MRHFTGNEKSVIQRVSAAAMAVLVFFFCLFSDLAPFSVFGSSDEVSQATSSDADDGALGDGDVTVDTGDSQDHVPELSISCVDEFGDPISDLYTDMAMPDFTDTLPLDDVENPPVEDVEKASDADGTPVLTEYTYVQTTVNGEIVKAFRKGGASVATASSADAETENADSSSDIAATSSDVTASENGLGSYSVDGTSWNNFVGGDEIHFEYTSGENRTFSYEDSEVKVTAVLQQGNAVPLNAEFRVTPVTESSEGYNYNAYMDALNAKASASDALYNKNNTLLYDIAFMADGKECEPEAGSVKISMEMKEKQLSGVSSTVSPENVHVIHLPLNSDVKSQTDSTAEATEISADDIHVESVGDQSVSLSDPAVDKVEFDLNSLSVTALFTYTSIDWTKDFVKYEGDNNCYTLESMSDPTFSHYKQTPAYVYHYVDSTAETYTANTDSLFYNSNRAFGIAGNFDLVAFGTATIKSHCNGNILCNNLVAEANWGTKNINHEVRGYIANSLSQSTQLNCGYTGTEGGDGTSLLAVGNSVGHDGKQNNGNSIYLSSKEVLNTKYVYQDSPTLKYIDIEAVKKECTNISSVIGELVQMKDSFTTTTGTTDWKEYALSSSDALDVFKLTPAQVGALGKLAITGFTKTGNGTVVFNVDCSGISSLTLPSLELYVDGNVYEAAGGSAHGETTSFEGGKVIWNFLNASGKTINMSGPFYGSIVAVGATVNLSQNCNGTVIAKDIYETAECHRTDFTGKINSESSTKSVDVTKNYDGTWPTDGSYSFTFTMEADNTRNVSGVTSQLPDPHSVTISKPAALNTGQFGSFPYTYGNGLTDDEKKSLQEVTNGETKSITKNYHYLVKETAGTDTNITYDSTVYYLSVPVTYSYTKTATGDYLMNSSVGDILYNTDGSSSYKSYVSGKIAFTNTYRTYYKLPATGRSGTIPYTAGGLALLLLSCLMYIYNKIEANGILLRNGNKGIQIQKKGKRASDEKD